MKLALQLVALLVYAIHNGLCSHELLSSAPPRVYFMFLAVDRIQRIDIWQRFFQDAQPDSYRVLLHCKDISKCKAQVQTTNFCRSAAVPPLVIERTMPTQYCTDLVSAENRLLEEALRLSELSTLSTNTSLSKVGPRSLLQRGSRQTSGSPHDKFVLLSDSTLPVKPYADVYSSLTQKADSRFCIFPRQEWATAPREACVDRHARCAEWSSKGECHSNPLFMHFQCQRSCEVCTDLAVLSSSFPSAKAYVSPKVHQWKVLNRGHAVRSVHLWRRGYLRHLQQSLHLNWHDTWRNTGCLDEFWHFAALYGAFPRECLGKVDTHDRCAEWAEGGECLRNPVYMQSQCQASCSGCRIPSSKLDGGNSFKFSFQDGAGVQGSCDTFVKWSIPGVQGKNDAMANLDKQLRAPENQVVLEENNQYRPETITTVSTSALTALKSSQFLFARKFKGAFNVANDCRPSVDVFSELVFNQPSPSRVGEAWMGDGIWIDTYRKQVSIISDPTKAQTIMIQNGHLPEWSGWGVFCGERFSVVFQNKKTLTGYLDAADGNTLRFSNGQTWQRDLAWQGDGQWRDTHHNKVAIRTWGGMYMSISERNPEWSGQAELQAMQGDTFKATFNKKIHGKPVTLWGKLDDDRKTIRWHNGQVWKRDNSYQPPCVCQADNIAWRPKAREPPNDQPRCIFIDIGSGAGEAYHALRSSQFDLRGFDPNHCQVYMLDADPLYDTALKTLQSRDPHNIRALPSTAMYSCEPQGRLAEFRGNSIKPIGSGGQPTVTLNLLQFLKEHALATDHVIIKMDIGGGEWDILPCLARSSAARIVDLLYLKEYSPQQGSFGTSEHEVQPTLERLQQFGITVVQE